jgi:hypothetical protein
MGPVQRSDAAPSRLGKFSRTGAGAVRVPATISRTGIQVYGDRREYRPDSEVFSAESLASLASVPVTLGHPADPVRADNWRALAVGHVSDSPPEARVRVDGAPNVEWVRATVIVSDAGVQGAIERGEVAEVSAGYTCELDETPGVAPNGERYDAVQKNIRFNHLAVLGVGERARAGADARLRLDNSRGTAPGETMVKIVIDGVEYEKNSDAHIAAVLAAAKKDADTQLAAKDVALATEKARADKAEAERDAARKDAAPERIDALVTEQLKLRSDAVRLLPADYKFDGKTALQIRTDAVVAKGVDVNGKSAEYVSAYFDALLKQAPAAGSPPPARYDGVVTNDSNSDSGEPTFRSDAEMYKSHEARMRKLYADSFGKDAN